MTSPDGRDFFISYTGADLKWAEWIGWQVEAAGYTTLLQAWDFPAGTNFIESMDRALKEGGRTLLVLSRQGLASRYVTDEWTAAFASRRLLPIRVDDVEPEGVLAPISYVDIVGLSEDDARTRLLQALAGPARPTSPPSFPGQQPAKPDFPGALPDVWNVKQPKNAAFVGRRGLMNELRQHLVNREMVVLSGLGGSGKTQTALHYVYTHIDAYDLIWWVRAEQRTSAITDFVGLAEALHLGGVDISDQHSAVEATRATLGQRRNWLLVFDNAEGQAGIREFLPFTPTGDVLVTSRNPSWGPGTSVLPVPPFDDDDAVEFICGRTGQQDRDAATRLSEELGALPLALEQAVAYINQNRYTVADYVELFHARREELLRRGEAPTDYPDTVATTWVTNLDAIDERDAATAGDLLRVCAFLAPDDIPMALFVASDDDPPIEAIADPLSFDDAVTRLTRYSLVRREGDAISVHRLVQAMTRDRMDDETKRMWAEVALDAIHEAFNYDDDDLSSWPAATRLLPHGLVATTHAESLGVDPGTTADLLTGLAGLLHGGARFAEARLLVERALAIAVTVYGPDTPEVASRSSSLATVLRELGLYDDARDHYERALAIHEAAYEPDHPTIAVDLNNLGLVLRDLGHYDDARTHLERALAINEAAYDPNHPTIATRLSNLGLVLQDLELYDDARTHLERALAIDEAAYEPDHPTIAIDLNNLGSVLDDLELYDDARAHFERALAIDEAAYDPGHPTIAVDLNNLGLVLRALERYDDARDRFERALAIDEAAYDPGHPTIAIDLNNLGLALQDLELYDDARDHIERALAIDEAAYEPNHPTIAIDLNNLASVLDDLQLHDEANRCYERARAIESSRVTAES